MLDSITNFPQSSDVAPPPDDLEKQELEKPKKKKKGKCKCKGFDKNDDDKKKSSEKPWFRERRIWEENNKRYRQDLKSIKSVVDDKPPQLNLLNLYDAEILKMRRNSLLAAFEINQVMVKSLHEVNVRRGRTDTLTFNYGKPYPTNYNFRRNETKTLEKQNLLLSKLIKCSKTSMQTVKYYAKEWKKYETIMENSSDFPLFWKVKEKKKAVAELTPPVSHFRQYVTERSTKYSDKRPRVFLEIAIKNVGVVGKMVALLYSDYVPMTVKNFLSFCDPKACQTYKGNNFYLIFPNYYCHTGDVVENKGFGGTSIYGPYFGNEDISLKHGERGILTMYNKIPNRNESQFLITFRKLESLDGQNVVFGKIIKGFHVLDAIESVGTTKTGRPKVEIYISDCGEI